MRNLVTTGSDLVFGPVATRKGGVWLADVSGNFPNQYKFETYASVDKLRVVYIFPVVSIRK